MSSEPSKDGEENQPGETLKPPKGEKKQQSQKQQQQQKKSQSQNYEDKKGMSKSKSASNSCSNTPRTGPGDKSNKSAAPTGSGRQGASGQAGSGSNKQPPRLALFDHLPKHRQVSKATSIQGSPGIHPSIIKLGELFLSEIIHDDDDRAQALLIAFCNVVEDYKTPPHTSLSWDLDKHIKLQVQHLVSHSRAHSMAMGNIIKYLRFAISQIGPEESEADAKSRLVEKLNSFLEERIIFARDSICKHSADIIRDGDVILTFGSSPLVRALLVRAKEVKTFRVIVIDAMPRWDGLRTVRSLLGSDEGAGGEGEQEGDASSGGVGDREMKTSDIDSDMVVYASMGGAAAAMKEASRVFLGASALLSNGSVVAPAGTGMIACLASHYRVPVIVASESYKFSDKVQMDSIVYNELVDPTSLMQALPSAAVVTTSTSSTTSLSSTYSPHSRWPQGGALSASSSSAVAPPPPPYELLHLRYDLTSMRNVSAVVTEVGMIPPTSVPVLIRELRYDGDGAK